MPPTRTFDLCVSAQSAKCDRCIAKITMMLDSVRVIHCVSGIRFFTLMRVLLKSSHMKLDILGEGGNYFLITASCSEMEINPL